MELLDGGGKKAKAHWRWRTLCGEAKEGNGTFSFQISA